MHPRLTVIVLTGVVLAACSTAPEAPPPARQTDPAAVLRGEALAQQRCAACHAVGPTGASPMAEAPPFRDLHTRYPVRFLEEALAEGLTTAHPAMPQVELQPDQIRDLIAWLESLEAG
ncbi:cytochrome c [Brevundimonas sp.]|uniref:c-type cytochrome n=1 Tax=Brevundimonas sp. TaxID=1871086 RepID=UPI0025B80E9C|nr:cytochrome c [Brevundimonas sp.]